MDEVTYLREFKVNKRLKKTIDEINDILKIIVPKRKALEQYAKYDIISKLLWNIKAVETELNNTKKSTQKNIGEEK